MNVQHQRSKRAREHTRTLTTHKYTSMKYVRPPTTMLQQTCHFSWKPNSSPAAVLWKHSKHGLQGMLPHAHTESPPMICANLKEPHVHHVHGHSLHQTKRHVRPPGTVRVHVDSRSARSHHKDGARLHMAPVKVMNISAMPTIL
jgi:hypothetical protein